MKKNTIIKSAAACGLCLTLLGATSLASAAPMGSGPRGNAPTGGQQPAAMAGTMFGGQMGQLPGQMGGGFNRGAPMGGMNGQMGPFGQQGTQANPFGQQGTQTSPFGQQGTQTTPFGQQGAQTSPFGQQGAQTSPFGQQNTQTNPFGQQQAQPSTGSATEIAEGTVTNSAANLVADYNNATTYDVSEGSVKITSAGTYIVTGTSADGNIVVKKGTTGVVLILKDLDLTSTTGATLSINKGAEVKVIVEGSVKLTDAEDPADETSTDADVADAYDGAAIKVKAGASAYLTGTGTLTVNGTAKNGIKVTGDAEEGYGSLVIDGATVNVTATNDGINANYDLAILSGTVTVSAGDDGLHADRILTIGSDSTAPTVTITKSNEGIEATVVNLVSGTVNVTATDDGVNAANSDDAFRSELAYSINVTGADVTVSTRADGLDSNGNINLVSGSATISSANNGGDAGLDYDGSLYISDQFDLNNQSGVASMGGMMGGRMGGFGGMMGGQMGQMPGQMGGGFGGMMGR